MSSSKRSRSTTIISGSTLLEESDTSVDSYSRSRKPTRARQKSRESSPEIEYLVDSDDESGDEDEKEDEGESQHNLTDEDASCSFRPIRTAAKKSSKRPAPDDGSKRTKYTYRQPALKLIPDIQESVMWQEGRDRYQRVINHPDAAPITIFSAQKSLRQISADNSRWAMVKEAKNGGTDGRCLKCIDKDLDCIVKWEPIGGLRGSSSRSAASPRQRVISRCLKCLVGRGGGCDLVIGSGYQGESSRATKLQDPIPESTIKDPINTELSLPPKAPKLSIEARTSRSTKPNENEDLKAVEAAVQDLSEFADSVRDMLADRMDFRTRGIFAMADAQMEVLRKFVSARS